MKTIIYIERMPRIARRNRDPHRRSYRLWLKRHRAAGHYPRPLRAPSPEEREARIMCVTIQAGDQIGGVSTFCISSKADIRTAAPYPRDMVVAALEKHCWCPFNATKELLGM